MVELALVTPFLALLLLGGAQVGQIAYTQISLDSATREGARAGVAAPNAALAWDTTQAVPASHACTSADFAQGTTGNPACIAVLDAAGFLDQSLFTANPCAAGQACVTLQVIGSANLSSFSGRPVARLTAAGSPCNNGNQATVTGTVSGMPSGLLAIVSDTSGDTQSGVAGAFTLCVAARGSTTTQTITAQVGAVGCGGYSGSVGPFNVAKGQTYTESVSLGPEPVCPTPTPSPTAPPSATPTPTPGPTPSPTAGPVAGCSAQTVPDQDYITVSVSYPAPIFVPLIGSIFQTQPGVRQVTTSMTYAIEPCTLTQGA